MSPEQARTNWLADTGDQSDVFDTEQKAVDWFNVQLGHERDDAADGWREDMDHGFVAKIVHRVVAEEKDAPEGSEWDYFCDYSLERVKDDAFRAAGADTPPVGQRPTHWSVVSETVQARRIIVRSGFGWAVLMWDSRGIVTLHTDHGSWVYQWPPQNLGAGVSMPEFLAKLESSYAGKKFMGLAFKLLDVEGTVVGVKEHVLQGRRDGDFASDEAREIWNEVKYIADEGDIDIWMHSSPTLDEAHEFLAYTPDPQWTSMWEQLWVPLLQPELARLAGASK